jgi:hypothetical protein
MAACVLVGKYSNLEKIYVICRLFIIQIRLKRSLFTAMTTWASAVRAWHAGCAVRGRFGSRHFWEAQYSNGKAPAEWFLSAETAAASSTEAFGAHEQAFGSVGAYARILHLGCGASSLGTCLVSELASQLRLSARVMNTDTSAAALSLAARAVGGDQQQQAFRVWDVAGGEPPPSLPSTLYSCGATSRYDMVVDKGVLDALCFATDDELVRYFSAVRSLLQSSSVESAAPPLLVHFTNDPPEVRAELLRAAFPSGADERWRVACTAVDSELDGDAADGWECFRYLVHREPA